MKRLIVVAVFGLALGGHGVAVAGDGDVDWVARPARQSNDPLFEPPLSGEPALRLTQHAVEDGRLTSADIGPTRSGGPPGQRKGIFQGARTTYEYVPAFDDESLGHQAWTASIDFGVPPMLLGAPILISPGYGIHLFDGPTSLDVPAVVHDAQVSFATFRPISEKWLFRGNVIVGAYGDEHSLDDGDALQVTGFAMGIYNASPRWQWAIGAGYVNNADLAVIPVVGVIHDRGWIKYELMMPRPRVVVPLSKTPGRESNMYLSGEFGGGVWAVRRDDGTTEPLQLSRYGVVLGYDHKTPAGGTWRAELGYVFGRELEYEDTGDTVDINDSLIVRLGLAY